MTNSQPSVERVRLALDGKDALDVDLPPGGDCRGGHNPVFSVAYNHPPGLLDAELDIQGSTSTTTIRLPETGTAWAVIDVQANGHGETSPCTTPSPCGADTTRIGPTPCSATNHPLCSLT